jgi:hypothetical protein
VDLQELAAEVIEREGRSSTPFGLYVIASTDPAAELGRSVERAVFGEFFDETPELLAEEYDRYEPASVFLVVIDHLRRLPVGVLRIILPSPHGFKTLDDLERVWEVSAEDAIARTGVTFDPERCWDLATLAVMPDYRRSSTGGLISMALMQAIVALAHHNDIPLGVTVFDVVVFDLVQATCGRSWTAIPGLEPRRYLGSPLSVACFCDVPAMRARLELTDPDLFELLFLGKGLEAAVSGPGWATDVAATLRAAS